VARKNPFANLLDTDQSRGSSAPVDYTMKGASRSILNSIDMMAARADRLVEGETIVDLDPNAIDASFVQDRLIANDSEFEELLEAIRNNGQNSPILVRPHPSQSERYMVVFGHRRLRAAKLLGRKIRAVVKDLKDRDHVIAQGQENSARANLSFIERALFAASLARLHYDEDNAIILAALGVDRSTLSKMLSVAALPPSIVKAIGVAKGVGRDRWYELKLLLEKPSNLDIAQSIVLEERYGAHTSDERLNTLLARLKAAKTPRAKAGPIKKNWSPSDGSLAAEMTEEGKRFTLTLKAKGPDAKAFGDYLADNLTQLYAAFRDHQTTHNGD
jgi:ParB family transcriptional regulator, chromosome partitioning protein